MELTELTPDRINAVLLAATRELEGGTSWEEIKDLTLADLCSRNQDALIDDAHEAFADSDTAQQAITSAVRTYDELLGTNRAGEIPAR